MTLEVMSKHVLARIGRIKTKHGKIFSPAIFPVHDLGAKGNEKGHTPPFWNVFPKINTCMFNTSNLKSSKSTVVKEVLSKGIHKYLRFNGAAFLDSGGWIYKKHGLRFSQDDLLTLQEDIGADIASTLDFPVNLTNNPSNWNITRSVFNALRAAKMKNDERMLLFASIHGNDPLIIRNLVRLLNRKACFDGFALGSLLPVYTNYNLLINTILALKREVPLKPIHVYGLGGPIISQLLAFLGVDSMDSSSFVISASHKNYSLPGFRRISKSLNPLLFHQIKANRTPVCICPICKKNSFESIMNNRELLSYHNLWVTWSEIENFKVALGENRLEDYLKHRLAVRTGNSQFD